MTIQEILSALLKEHKLSFLFRGEPIEVKDIVAESGLLPAIVWRADQTANLALGYGMGANFVEDGQAVLGRKVYFDDSTPTMVRVMFLYDVLLEIINSSSNDGTQVELEELSYS